MFGCGEKERGAINFPKVFGIRVGMDRKGLGAEPVVNGHWR